MPPRHTGPTAWITWLACRRPAVVATACPVGHPPIPRHASMMAGPPARWMAPSTPPPPARALLAALTRASTLCRVMSPWTSSRSPWAMRAVRPSPGKGVAIAPRVGGRGDDSGRPIDGDDGGCAGVAPVADHLDDVAAPLQLGDHVLGHAAFHAQLAGADLVLIEGL